MGELVPMGGGCQGNPFEIGQQSAGLKVYPDRGPIAHFSKTVLGHFWVLASKPCYMRMALMTPRSRWRNVLLLKTALFSSVFAPAILQIRTHPERKSDDRRKLLDVTGIMFLPGRESWGHREAGRNRPYLGCQSVM